MKGEKWRLKKVFPHTRYSDPPLHFLPDTRGIGASGVDALFVPCYLFYHTFPNESIMSRICALTGRSTASGNSRSHSNIATRRTFKINLQTKKIGGKSVRLSTRALRTLTKGGR